MPTKARLPPLSTFDRVSGSLASFLERPQGKPGQFHWHRRDAPALQLSLVLQYAQAAVDRQAGGVHEGALV